MDKKAKEVLMFVIAAVVFAGFLTMIFVLRKKSEKFRFQVTPAKQCGLWPYAQPTSPDGNIDCAKIPPQEIRQFNCPGGYHGRPVSFSYTPDTEMNWKNERCSQKPGPGWDGFSGSPAYRENIEYQKFLGKGWAR